MRITIVHNPDAGDEHVTADRLCAALQEAGHEPVYASTKRDDWVAAVQEADDLVLAAGGDGTVAKVGRELLGRDVPMAVLPFGTANNIAHSLGANVDWRETMRQLDSWTAHPFDVGIASVDGTTRPFLEGMGFGLFADAILAARRGEDGDVARRFGRDVELVCDVARIHGMLAQYEPQRCRISLDGREIETDALLVGIMNIASVGPRLQLAPGARPDDGVLHVVIVRNSDRATLEQYLSTRLEGDAPPPGLEEHTAREVTIDWGGASVHVDDTVRDAPALVRAHLLPAALRILGPPDQPRG
jgi:diacylglycerol kinase (ATP)